MDFSQWPVRSLDVRRPTGFLDVYMQAHTRQLEPVLDALDLDSLGTLISASNTHGSIG